MPIAGSAKSINVRGCGQGRIPNPLCLGFFFIVLVYLLAGEGELMEKLQSAPIRSLLGGNAGRFIFVLLPFALGVLVASLAYQFAKATPRNLLDCHEAAAKEAKSDLALRVLLDVCDQRFELKPAPAPAPPPNR